MTSDHAKPYREFWINRELYAFKTPDEYIHPADLIHVIEIAALKQAQDEIEKLKEIVSYLPKVPTEPYEKMLAKEANKLREQLDEANKEIERLQVQNNDDIQPGELLSYNPSTGEWKDAQGLTVVKGRKEKLPRKTGRRAELLLGVFIVLMVALGCWKVIELLLFSY